MEGFIDTGPATAQTLQQFTASNYGADYYGRNGIADWFVDTFGRGKEYKQRYQTYLDELNNYNEWKAVQSARAWDEYFDSTKYQRAVKDLQAAGLNPWLAIQSGVNGSGTTSASKASYKFNNSSEEKKSKSSGVGRDIALLMFAAARLVSFL